VEKLDPHWWECKMVQYMENSKTRTKQLKLELLYNPAILLLGIYAKEVK
jgi:hypothetical protein